MRRMISTKQAKGLERLNNNIVISDDGTLMEVGGNVAVESVEQVGSMVDAPAVFTSGQGSYPTYTVLTGITEVVDKDGWYETESLPYDVDEGTCVFTTDFVMYVMKVNGVKYYCDNAGKTITLNGNINYTPDPNDTCTFVEGGKVFKPFFTEEQYEAVMELIENKDALLALIENA